MASIASPQFRQFVRQLIEDKDLTTDERANALRRLEEPAMTTATLMKWKERLEQIPTRADRHVVTGDIVLAGEVISVKLKETR